MSVNGECELPYDLVRDFVAYGLGKVTKKEARESLNDRTILENVYDVGDDDMAKVKDLFQSTFQFQPNPFAELSNEPLRTYCETLADNLSVISCSITEACQLMRNMLPRDWESTE